MWTYRFQIRLPFPPETAEDHVYSRLFTQKKVISSPIIDAANSYYPRLLTQLIKYVCMDGPHLIAINHRDHFVSMILTVTLS